MSRLHPLHLEELRLLVGQELSKKDVLACILVCKAWYESFQPFAWYTLSVRGDCRDYAHVHTPTQERDCKRCLWDQSVARNGRHVRHLKLILWHGGGYFTGVLPLLIQYCTSLKTLTHSQPEPLRSMLGMPRFQRETLLESQVAGLMQCNPGIWALTTTGEFCVERSMCLLSWLRSLTLNVAVGVEDTVRLLNALPNLQELIIMQPMAARPMLPLTRQWLKGNASSQRESWLSSLESLTFPLTCDIADTHFLLERCASLETIQYSSLQAVEDETLDVLRSGLLCQLTTLICSKLPHSDSLKKILQAFPYPQIRNFTLATTPDDIIPTLTKYHGQTLEHVVLTRYLPPLKRSWLLFTQCPALKTLEMSSYAQLATDLRELIERPWICTRLEQLNMALRVDRRDDVDWRRQILATEYPAGLPLDETKADWEQAQTMFMMRLGTLTRLKRLELWEVLPISDQPYRGLTCRLDAGLSQLHALHHLEVLSMGYLWAGIGIAELDWMKRHFVRLWKLDTYKIVAQEVHHWLREHWPDLTVIEKPLPHWYTSSPY